MKMSSICIHSLSSNKGPALLNVHAVIVRAHEIVIGAHKFDIFMPGAPYKLVLLLIKIKKCNRLHCPVNATMTIKLHTTLVKTFFQCVCCLLKQIVL